MKVLAYLLMLVSLLGMSASDIQAMPVDDGQAMMMDHDCCDDEVMAAQSDGCCEQGSCQCLIGCAAVLYTLRFDFVPGSVEYQSLGYQPVSAPPVGLFRPPKS